MSSNIRIWVGDLDAYISVGGSKEEEDYDKKEEERAALDQELEAIGEISLLSGKFISANNLYSKDVSPSEWRWATQQAERALHGAASIDNLFLNRLFSMGRPYAIGRYSKWERLDYSSALTATFPHGLKALINQYLLAEGIDHTSPAGDCIRTVLKPAEQISEITAYRRTGMLQSAIHEMADRAPAHPGRQKLSRGGMRIILSLARLHFSTTELKVGSFRELKSLVDAYETERTAAKDGGGDHSVINGRLIRAWRLRHIRPLIDLYPYSIRHVIARALHHHSSGAGNPDRSVLANELALAHCGIMRMRRAGRDRARSK